MNNESITTGDCIFHYTPPPDVNKKVILLTTGRVAMVGKWGDGTGVIGWWPLPKRDKKLELELGIC